MHNAGILIRELTAERDALKAEYETSHACRLHAEGVVRRLEDDNEWLRAELDDAEHGYATIKRELTELREAAVGAYGALAKLNASFGDEGTELALDALHAVIEAQIGLAPTFDADGKVTP